MKHTKIISTRYFYSQLFVLWSWLPVRITMYQPILLYTTEVHGCSLTTFYIRVENHEPTLLMIKTCNNEVISKQIIILNCFHNFKFSNFSNFFRFLELTAPQDGENETRKMTGDISRLILEPVKLFCSLYILIERNILG